MGELAKSFMFGIYKVCCLGIYFSKKIDIPPYVCHIISDHGEQSGSGMMNPFIYLHFLDKLGVFFPS
jgi:hypothetical protein